MSYKNVLQAPSASLGSYNSVSQAEKRQAAAVKRTLVIVVLSLMAIAVLWLTIGQVHTKATADEVAAAQEASSRQTILRKRRESAAELDAEQPRISGRP